MSNDNLSQNEYTVVELLPETSANIAEAMDCKVTYVYDLISSLRNKGVDVQQDGDGRYYVDGNPSAEKPSNIEATRQTSENKATITRKAKATLAEIEHTLKASLNEYEPAIEDDPVQRDGNTDMVIHRTDDHFGEHVTNQHGETMFDSEIAEQRVDKVFDKAMQIAESREDMGEEFDRAHLLLGGDIITNEAIYDGQAHEIDATLQEQINRAGDVYIRNIRRLSDEFPSVQVVCQPGNHGRLGNSGNPTNADSILYSMLDKIVRASDLDNVTFLQSDRSYYVDFDLREWNGHLRHGHDASLEHIGTSAGKQRWLNWLVDHDFDVAFRGHYHMYKEEPISGRPVHMGGSIVPQTSFEESMALSGKPVGAIHGATDVAPTEWTEKIYFPE